MQKIKKKNYLQHDEGGDGSNSVAGVPSRLRIVAVDIPAFKSMIDQPCMIDNSVVFPDGVVSKKNKKDATKSTPQTSLARSFMRCGEHAEILNASFAAIKKSDDTIDDAFKEELSIRLSGRVKSFDSPMEKGGWWSRMVFGSAYKWEGKRGGDALKVDENAPQAVIADGAKLQEIEGGMLLLSSACKAANVPLFVINDPRLVWEGDGGKERGKEDELYNASKALREKVKGMVVQKALKIKEGQAYARGREHGKSKAEELARRQRRRDEGRWAQKVERLEGRIRQGLAGATISELRAELERRRGAQQPAGQQQRRDGGGNPQDP
ncbi:hypothetical protein TrRE_jg1857 [Triparma retinervis]|uniref:Uncharacterized protein n=1 Tax=Triparma retinervis TaxID=2557542 RepID=A0A9W7CAF4_9STRA|nr:hypothetical protein TrRE_jg1857 [Triparma retinervis]